MSRLAALIALDPGAEGRRDVQAPVENSADDAAAKADGDGVSPRAGLQLRE
jgi:hypothetical protein